MTRKCKICKDEAIWAVQPYGPSDDKAHNCIAVSTLGSHYRGFYMLPLCDACKERVVAMTPAQILTAQHKGEIPR